MESFLDEVDSLLAPGLSTDTPDWCNNCQSLKQEIKRLQDEQLQNFTKLKQKIISTDLLIKKYKSKCDDYDVQCKKTEEANKRADKMHSQCEILQTQLKAALMDVEPLRATKIKLETEVRLKDTEIQSLSDRLLAVESARQQYEYLSKTSSTDIERLEAEKKDLMHKMKTLQSGKLTKDAAKEYKHEISSLKKDKAALSKNEKRLESKLAAANTRIEKLSSIIKDKKLSPKRRIRTASGNFHSPLKSPTRSPRSLSPRKNILSPFGHSRSQTLVKKTLEPSAIDVILPQVNEKLASGSSSSSDDTDDDNMSVCSIKWTFSPLMKCLSPLPPSPACFAERKLERGDSEEMEDEGEVSDIADILEQQLLEEDTPCQEQPDETTEKGTENVTEPSNENSKCIVDQVKEDNSASSENYLIKSVDHKETLITSKVAEEVTDCCNVQERVKENLPTVENKREGEQTLKEKLANSIEIVSPTAVRKRIAHHSEPRSNNLKNIDSGKNTANVKDTLLSLNKDNERKDIIHDKDNKFNITQKTPPVRRSARINSHKDSETDEQVSTISEREEEVVKDGDKSGVMASAEGIDIERKGELVEDTIKKTGTNNVKTSAEGTNIDTQPNNDKAELNRIDTEEFTPVVSESLSDSEVDIKPNDISKVISEAEEIIAGEADDKRLNTIIRDNISSQDINSISTNETTHVNKTNTECVTNSPGEINSCDTEVKNIKEPEKVKIVPVTNSCLQKVEIVKNNLEKASPCAVNKSASVRSNETYSKKGVKKFGSDKFINFQKSSSGTLSNEIDDFGYVGDYDVLDRNTKDSTMIPPKVGRMQRKNATRRLRRTCKYRDLDSEVNNESNERINDLNERKLKSEGTLLGYKQKKSEGNSVIEKRVEVEKRKFEPECELNVKDKNATCETDTVSTEKSVDVSKNIDGKKGTEGTKYLRKEDETVRTEIKDVESKVSDGTIESELEECNNNAEKLTTNRQMSTGFTVNTPTLERVPSNDSAVSFGTSPSRLFTLESSSFDTIVEEEMYENVQKDDNGSKGDNKTNSDSNLIFGVEDLLHCKQESSPISQKSENAQNNVKSVCDKNLSSKNIGNTLIVGRTSNKDSSTLCTVAQDDKFSKPGCSYQYHNSSAHNSRGDVPNDAAKEKDSFPTRIPFISEPVLNDDESSRSSIQSITSIDRASPVSPLSLSPFDFLNPISPLPPSPIREVDRVSPLSPEHMADEQNAEVDDISNEPELAKNCEEDTRDIQNAEVDDTSNEPELVKNSEEDTRDIDERVKVNNDSKNLRDNDDHSKALSISETVKDSDVVKELKESRNKQPVSGGSNKIKSTKRLESVKEVNENLESIKDTPKPPVLPEEDACPSDDNMTLFSLPQMISPVKTPKRCAKLKTVQIKTSKNITKLITQKDQIDISPPKLGDEVDKCIDGGPKQFVTKAPVTAITVKPLLTRGGVPIDKTNIEMCIRKSSRTVLKRVLPVGKIDSSKAETISSDNSVKRKITQTCLTGSDITNAKSENLTNTVKVKDSEQIQIANNLGNIPDNSAANTVSDGDKVSAVCSIDEKGDNKVLEEYSQSQDNLAFKRKNRVAHKPNANHPVKVQKKIQIIDAPVLPPVTVGRKRKSLDNNKEPNEKKKPKEGSSKRSSSSAKAITQETKKKMQAFLKSSQSAECFVTNFSTKPSEETVKSDLLNTCLECLGRVQTDTLDVVYHMCDNNQYPNINCQLPFMSDVEKKAVELIQYLCTELRSDRTEVMKILWDCVFNRNNSTNIVGKMAQCRVFVALCSFQGDVEQARAFFYHIVTCGHLNYTQFVVSVVSVWPETLMKDPSDSPDKVVSHGMTLVLEEVVTKMLQSQITEGNNKILVILQKLCGWSGRADNADSILKVLCNRMLSLLEGMDTDKSGLLELRLALELLCTSQTWAWFKEQFITRNGLQTACNKYMAERILTPVSPEYICEMLKLTSRGLFTYSGVIKEREYQQIIRNWLLPLLKHKQASLKVQECCVETMIELSPLYPQILNSIHDWFTEKNEVTKEMAARLEHLRLQYKQKTGLTCEPFVKR